jgi:hypothetical protein
VAVLVVAIVALRNPRHPDSSAGTDTRAATPSVSASRSPATSTPPRRSSTAPSPSASTAIGSLPLVVLNDTSTPNLARDAAQRFEQGGWDVAGVQENYRNDIMSTVAYYDRAVAGAKAAATALRNQYPTIKRVVPRFAGLPEGPVVVVLTTDYSPA